MRILLYLGIGLSVGSVSGLLGIGGGVLLVPMLLWLFGPEQQTRAAGTTLAVLILPVLLPAVYRYYAQDLLRLDDLKAALWIAPAFAVGGFLGASLVPHLPVAFLRVGFGLILMYIAMRSILSSDSEAENAAFALITVAFAWIGYQGLRRLGRRHPPPPDLGATIRSGREHRRSWSDYSI